MSLVKSTNSRRLFLGKIMWLVPAVSLQGCHLPDTSAQSVVRKGPEGPTGTDYVPVFLSKNEWAFVTAASDRLIPSDDEGPGAVAAGVPEFIDRQMQTPYAHGALWYMQGPFQQAAPEFGYQMKLVPRDILRLGIANIDRVCQKRFDTNFAELDSLRQDTMLSSLENGSQALDDIPAKTFFSFLLEITREGFFSDPVHGGNRDMVGWKLIGFPGARADFMDFVNLGGAPYPLPPVSIRDPNPSQA